MSSLDETFADIANALLNDFVIKKGDDNVSFPISLPYK